MSKAITVRRAWPLALLPTNILAPMPLLKEPVAFSERVLSLLGLRLIISSAGGSGVAVGVEVGSDVGVGIEVGVVVGVGVGVVPGTGVAVWVGGGLSVGVRVAVGVGLGVSPGA